MSQITQFVSTSGGSPIETLTGNSGGAVGPTADNINIVGSGGVTVTGDPGTSTLTITVGSTFTWTSVAGTSQAMSSNNGYITQNAGLTTLTLPVGPVVGDTIDVAGFGAGGWKIAQNAGQLIHFDGGTTTTGATGSLASTVRYDYVRLLCVVDTTTFTVIGGVGNITIV